MSSASIGSSIQYGERCAGVDAPHGLADIPALVGVHHQGLAADDLPDLCQALDILLDVRLADLDLEGRVSCGPVAHLIEQLVQRHVEVDAAGVGPDRGRNAAEMIDERLAGLLGDEVPERDVDGGQRHGGEPATAEVPDVMPGRVPEGARRRLHADHDGPRPGRSVAGS